VSTEIRVARRDDGPAIRMLDLATWSSAVSPAPPPTAAGSDAVTPDDVVLVAVVAGAVAGYVSLRAATLLRSNRHVIHVTGLAVDPGHQRRGLARALLTAAARAASDRGARRLTLRVLGANAAARALYESCGFAVEGVLRGEFLLDGRYEDDVLMALDLTGAQPTSAP
jgi:ribosomal protein S18 acetylase RimI-like enzyme